MRRFNKKWEVTELEDHYVIRWRQYESKIDKEDYHYFEEFQLRMLDGTTSRKLVIPNYLYIIHRKENGSYKYESYHRVIINAPDGFDVDHINFDTLDNRKSNLRLADRYKNLGHSRKRKYSKKNTTSKYKGVSYDERIRKKKWSCNCHFNKKRINKYFLTETEAAQFYNEQALKYLGEFAILNEITDPEQK